MLPARGGCMQGAGHALPRGVLSPKAAQHSRAFCSIQTNLMAWIVILRFDRTPWQRTQAFAMMRTKNPPPGVTTPKGRTFRGLTSVVLWTRTTRLRLTAPTPIA